MPSKREDGLTGAMHTEQVAVFFYGLFMDESLLASKGISHREQRSHTLTATPYASEDAQH